MEAKIIGSKDPQNFTKIIQHASYSSVAARDSTNLELKRNPIAVDSVDLEEPPIITEVDHHVLDFLEAGKNSANRDSKSRKTTEMSSTSLELNEIQEHHSPK